jgi:putative phosphoribosyl transferase
MSAGTASGPGPTHVREVEIPAGKENLPGRLALPDRALGTVAFAHGSGSGRLSPRNLEVAGRLERNGLATLLFDLLTEDEATSRERVFDIPLLGERLMAATHWLREQPDTSSLPLGYFGASTGAAAALVAAAQLRQDVAAVVSRGGRPDLAGPWLKQVKTPTLLIVGGDDRVVLELNREAQSHMSAPSELFVVPGATHLFEEPGALDVVAEQAARWFDGHMAGPR